MIHKENYKLLGIVGKMKNPAAKQKNLSIDIKNDLKEL